MKIITRKQAEHKELDFYFTGKKCINGHLAPRDVVNGTCTKCNTIKGRKPKNSGKNKLPTHLTDAYKMFMGLQYEKQTS